ncbi:MAG: hypothetical protein AB1586_19165 [Pseudomonadota bacterium]
MGITARSFYFAFGSREALFRRILEAYQASQADLVGAAFRQADARALVEALRMWPQGSAAHGESDARH